MAVNSDMNKLLSLHDLPTVLDDIDLGRTIGGYLFAPPLEANGTSSVSAPFMATGPFNVGSEDFKIRGAHVYYKVPINGNKVAGHALHSIVRLVVYNPPDAQSERKHKQKLLASSSSSSALIPGQAYNSTTVSAKWPGAGHDIVMAKAIQVMTSSPGSGAKSLYLLQNKSNIDDGQEYKYQFFTAVSIEPTAVLQAFHSAILHALGDSTGTPNSIPQTSIVHQNILITSAQRAPTRHKVLELARSKRAKIEPRSWASASPPIPWRDDIGDHVVAMLCNEPLSISKSRLLDAIRCSSAIARRLTPPHSLTYVQVSNYESKTFNKRYPASGMVGNICYSYKNPF